MGEAFGLQVGAPDLLKLCLRPVFSREISVLDRGLFFVLLE